MQDPLSSASPSPGNESSAAKPSFNDITHMIQDNVGASARLLNAAQTLHAEAVAERTEVEQRLARIEAERTTLLEQVRAFHQVLTALRERLEGEGSTTEAAPASLPTPAPEGPSTLTAEASPPRREDDSPYMLTIRGPRTVQHILTLDDALERQIGAENLQPLEFVPGTYRVAITIENAQKFIETSVAQGQLPLRIMAIEPGRMEAVLAPENVIE